MAARVAARPRSRSRIEHPGGERSFLTAAGNLAEQTAADILGMLPARADPGDIALLTGAFLYPALLDSFDMMLDIIAKRGFAVALDTGWPPDGWDSSTRSRAAALAFALRPRPAQRDRMPVAVGHGQRRRGRRAGWRREAKPGAVLVVKRGAQGASAWVGGEAVHVPAPVVEVVDTTGAGDAFNAGYLSARLGGASIEAALRRRRGAGVGGDRLVAAPVPGAAAPQSEASPAGASHG